MEFVSELKSMKKNRFHSHAQIPIIKNWDFERDHGLQELHLKNIKSHRLSTTYGEAQSKIKFYNWK